MLINEKNITTFNATFLSADFNDTDITTIDNWLDNSKQPKVYRQIIKYSNIELTFIVEGNNLNQVEENASNLTSELNNAIVTFDNYNFSFDGKLTNTSFEKINSKATKVVYTMQGRKLANEQTINISGNSFNVNGNCEVPCKLTIVPTTAIGTLTTYINGKKYVLDNLVGGTSYTIDAIQGLVLAGNDNNISNYKSWEFPTVKGGVNTISFEPTSASSQVNVSINVKGRWQ